VNELRVFIGYDSREPIAFHVATHSLMRHASHPVSITPLMQEPLRRAGIYTRERGATESTEFSLTRFLVPYLSNFEGHSVFMDSDVLVQADIWELMMYALAERKSVLCAQHDYVPKSAIKMDGCVQTQYPRKNWSSMMVFDNQWCRMLTPDYVNQASGLELHRFHWMYSNEIGALPLEWNWLVGEYPLNSEASLLHYTLGGPWFPEHENCDHADLWKAERDLMLGAGVRV